MDMFHSLSRKHGSDKIITLNDLRNKGFKDKFTSLKNDKEKFGNKIAKCFETYPNNTLVMCRRFYNTKKDLLTVTVLARRFGVVPELIESELKGLYKRYIYKYSVLYRYHGKHNSGKSFCTYNSLVCRENYINLDLYSLSISTTSKYVSDFLRSSGGYGVSSPIYYQFIHNDILDEAVISYKFFDKSALDFLMLPYSNAGSLSSLKPFSKPSEKSQLSEAEKIEILKRKEEERIKLEQERLKKEKEEQERLILEKVKKDDSWGLF